MSENAWSHFVHKNVISHEARSSTTQQQHAARSTQQHLRPPICIAFFYMRTVLPETNTAPNPLLPPYQGLRSLCPLLRLPPTTIPPTSTPPATSPPLFLICGSSTCAISASLSYPDLCSRLPQAKRAGGVYVLLFSRFRVPSPVLGCACGSPPSRFSLTYFIIIICGRFVCTPLFVQGVFLVV